MKCTVSLYNFKRIVLLIVINVSICVTAVSQEYKYEIGGGLGMSSYMGDANKNNPFLELHPSFGAVFRKNMDLRWAMKANLLMGNVSGNTKNFDNAYPGNASAEFKRSFFELGGQMEFNFLPYSDKYKYLNTSKISPYLVAGLGLTFAPGDETFFGLNLPIGLGVKYMVRNRINLGVEYSVRKLFRDDFDAPNKSGFNLDNPYNLNDGVMKNKDWYTILMFSITWSFGPNDRKCTNL
ncbi:MAG: porin family protein [Dysgonamonadaceae bacterium]|jgi:opacity protein-like surface antigen|nr:porin family protein [Dysgonamonadaceae bacterium]